MKTHFAGIFIALLITLGCSQSREPVPVPIAAIPLAKDIPLPPGMPDDQWFYDEVVKSEVPVLIDFGATWCPPCRALKPIIHEVEGQANGRFKVVMVDVDQRPYLSDHFQVTGIPHLKLIHQGQIVRTSTGLMERDELLKFALDPVK